MSQQLEPIPARFMPMIEDVCLDLAQKSMLAVYGMPVDPRETAERNAIRAAETNIFAAMDSEGAQYDREEVASLIWGLTISHCGHIMAHTPAGLYATRRGI